MCTTEANYIYIYRYRYIEIVMRYTIDTVMYTYLGHILCPLSPRHLLVPRFYFCSYTMTSVGYGDLGPKNMTERTVCTMMILTAGLCWAYVLGYWTRWGLCHRIDMDRPDPT